MADKSLRDYLLQAEKEKWALPHFNFSNLEILRACVSAAAQVSSPIIVGTSEGERKFIGLLAAVKLVAAMREEFQIPIFLNADHTHTVAAAKLAIEAGYDAILFDGSTLSFEQNLSETKIVVEYARQQNRDIIIEGELGYLRGESKIQTTITVRKQDLTKPKEATEFIQKTGIDLLAPAIGNIHGIITAGQEKLNIDLLKKIKQATGKIGLVLHGASGLKEDDLRQAITAGINVVHINTELRVAYTKALKKSLSERVDETTPYKYLSDPISAVKKVAIEKIEIFGAAGKI